MDTYISPPEAYYLRLYFDGVSEAVASRMQKGSTPSEDNLTFLFCELLDSNYTSQHVLKYPLSALNDDLSKAGAGNTLEIEFQTNELKKKFEASEAFADLGIVFTRRDPITGEKRKAILVQAKRLYSSNHRFGLYSTYDAFSKTQFDKFYNLTKSKSAGCYLFFNPLLSAFDEKEQDAIKAYELHWPYFHPDIDILFHLSHKIGYPWFGLGVAVTDKSSVDSLRDLQMQQLNLRPGLRFCGLEALKSIVQNASYKPSLIALYNNAIHNNNWGVGDYSSMFSLSDLCLLGLIGCRHGSTDSDIIALAEGKQPKTQQEIGLGVKHTLKITLRSSVRMPG